MAVSARFVISTFRTTDKCYQARVRTIFDQLRRASLSVELNIVEGYAPDSNAQFLRHLVIAQGSAAECECIIRIVDELGYIPKSDLSHLAREIDLAMKTLRGLIRSRRQRL